MGHGSYYREFEDREQRDDYSDDMDCTHDGPELNDPNA